MNLQNKFDKWLIKGWYEFKSMGWVYFKFISECYPQLISETGYLDLYKAIDYLAENKIKRCFYIQKNNHWIPPKRKTEARAFIATNSPVLSAALNSEKINRLEILISINNYPWLKFKTSEEYKRRWSERRYREVVITSEQIDGSHDWSKTKGPKSTQR